MTIFTLSRQRAALEAMIPGFMEFAIPEIWLAFPFEITAKTLAAFMCKWGGWHEDPPVQTLTKSCEELEDPEALFAMLYSLAECRDMLPPGEHGKVDLPVFTKVSEEPTVVQILCHSGQNMSFPKNGPESHLKNLIQLLAMSIENEMEVFWNSLGSKESGN